MQTGIGRTGAWFAHTRHGVVPDVVTLAKGLGGGIPIGAAIALGERAAGLLGAGQHGTTFGGNPVSSAAALAVLHAIERDDLLANVPAGRGAAARRRRGAAATRWSPRCAARGCCWRSACAEPVAAQAVGRRAGRGGFIVNAVTPDALRLAPPLILTADQADSFLAALPAILTRLDGADHDCDATDEGRLTCSDTSCATTT